MGAEIPDTKSTSGISDLTSMHVSLYLRCLWVLNTIYILLYSFNEG